MKRLFAALLLGSVVFSAPAQVGIPPPGGTTPEGTPSVSTGSVPLTYVGGDTGVSVGLDKDGHSEGELMRVFGDNGEHAVIGQLWWNRGGAGGIQADYNWLWGTTLDEVRRDPDSATVAKLSFAIDQNAEKQRQATAGFAIERKEFFLNFFLSGKASGSRAAGTLVNEQHTVETGTDSVGNFVQTNTDVATTVLESQPFNYTVGFHGGHFSDPLAARFNGGFDYAKGDQGAHQTRLSAGVDKYIGTRGWSVSALAEHTDSSDAVNGSRSDDRFWLFLRYEFGGGGAFRPSSELGNTAWIQRAVRTPVTGRSRTVKTYVTKGKTTTSVIPGTKTYTERRAIVKDDTATVSQNSSANAIDVLANDSDPEGKPLSITAVSPAGNGTVQISGNKVVYTPTPGFTGSDQFSYTVGNGTGLTASANVSVTVTAAPPPPPPGSLVARNDSATTPFETAVTVAVLANDTDSNGYALAITSVSAPAHGTAKANADGTVTYSPLRGYSGPDQFSYSIENGHGGVASANVSITVLPPLQPIARDDSATTLFAIPVGIDVLANDSDPSGYFLTVTSVGVPNNGTAKINPGGSVTYTPNDGFTGTDSFDYTISNGHGGLASAVVTVTVLPPSTSLVALDDETFTPYATSIAINVIANDSSPYGSLTITKVTAPAHGTATIALNGFIDYKPATGFYGAVDSFQYTITDGISVAQATVNVSVGLPPPPVAQNDSATTPFNKPVQIAVLANDSDPSGFALALTQVTTPAHGSAQQNNDGSVTYTPVSGYSGPDSFNYTISNGHGGTATASVSITVQAALPPLAVADSVTAQYQTPVVINVLANDSDPNGLPLTIVSSTSPALGLLVPNPDGTFTYTPDTENFSDQTFTYTISNGYLTATATVTVHIQLPLQPTATPFTFTDAVCYPDGSSCDICLDTHVTNPDGVYYTVAYPGTTTLGGVLGTSGVCQNAVLYTSPDPTIVTNAIDTFTYTVEDIFGRKSTATVTVPITFP